MVSDHGPDYTVLSCRSCGSSWLNGAAVENRFSSPPGSATQLFAKLAGESQSMSARKCPDCHSQFCILKHRDAELDFCARCHDLFLDAGEMRKVGLISEPSEERKVAGVVVAADPITILLTIIGSGP
jgi:hypothetical protein